MLFISGLIFGSGPFKYIGRMYAEEAKQDLASSRPKQPWE
jgi:hypothetical protein